MDYLRPWRKSPTQVEVVCPEYRFWTKWHELFILRFVELQGTFSFPSVRYGYIFHIQFDDLPDVRNRWIRARDDAEVVEIAPSWDVLRLYPLRQFHTGGHDPVRVAFDDSCERRSCTNHVDR